MRREAYAQLADLERDHWWFRGRRAVYLGLLERVQAGARVRRALDLGCGPGGFLPGLALLADEVVALDADHASLELLAERNPQARARRVQAATDALPFAAESFELVCLFDVLEHVDDAAALAEVRRVLRPGGLVALSVPAYPWLFANNDRVAMHLRRYTRPMLSAALARAGFELVRNTHANVLLAPLIVPFALLSKAYEALPFARADSQRTNLSWRLPRFANDVLARVFAAELALTRRRDAPFGHSIAAIAKRR